MNFIALRFAPMNKPKPKQKPKRSKLLYALCAEKGENDFVAQIYIENNSIHPDIIEFPFTDKSKSLKDKLKIFSITPDKNGTGATVGSATSKELTFDGWTSTTIGSNAKTTFIIKSELLKFLKKIKLSITSLYIVIITLFLKDKGKLSIISCLSVFSLFNLYNKYFEIFS